MGAKKSDSGDSKKGGDGAEKKEDNPITVVLKIDMHCDGCTSKIVKTLKGFQEERDRKWKRCPVVIVQKERSLVMKIIRL